MRALAHALLDLFAPVRCAACEAPHPGGPLCAVCAEALLPAEDAPEGVRAAFLHGGPIAAAIHRAKYGDDPAVAFALGAMLRPVAVPDGALVIPIPLHRKRIVARGFNQSERLAAGAWGRRRVVPALLRRARDTPSQTTLHRDARRENVRDAFTLVSPERVRGRPVVLVDDVVTTGATLTEAMRCVREAGATPVLGVALAAAALRQPKVTGA